MNATGLALLDDFESCHLTAYLDGNFAPTIGWGTTGPHVHEGDTCTQMQADNWRDDDIAEIEKDLAAMLTAPVTQNQFAALVCLAYNIGVGALHKSTLLRYLNDGDTQRAADEFPKWCHDAGREIPGLVRRRAAERDLFLTPDPATV